MYIKMCCFSFFAVLLAFVLYSTFGRIPCLYTLPNMLPLDPHVVQQNFLRMVNILIAFVGGLLSFLSPCVLPLVPGYISLMSGVSVDHLKGEGAASSRKAVIANSLAFNAGWSVIFLALGGTAGLVGSAIFSNVWVRVIAGVVIIVFGLHLIGLLKITIVLPLTV